MKGKGKGERRGKDLYYDHGYIRINLTFNAPVCVWKNQVLSIYSFSRIKFTYSRIKFTFFTCRGFQRDKSQTVVLNNHEK